MRIFLCSIVLAVMSSQLAGQTLTTGYGGTSVVNGSYPGNFLDLRSINPAGLSIHQFDLNLSAAAGMPVNIRIWRRPGQWRMHYNYQPNWPLFAEVPVISAGPGEPTPVPIPDLQIAGGQTVAVRIGSSPGSPRFYSASQTTFVHYTDDLVLENSAAQGTVFNSNLLEPRGWNGTIYYTANGVTPKGRCCLPTGACELRTEFECAYGEGDYAGDGTSCAGFSCPPPLTGACCMGSGCTIETIVDCRVAHGVFMGDGTVCVPETCSAFVFEIEPNNSREAANVVTLSPGQSLIGTSTNLVIDGLDYFRIRTPAAPPGIYRHRISLLSTTDSVHTTALRGETQVATSLGAWPCAVGTSNGNEIAGQRFVDEATGRNNYWYGFGREEEVVYYVVGTPWTVGMYSATLETTLIEPTPIGTYQAGEITFDTSGMGHTYDTALRVYDADFEPIPGYANDDATLQGGAPLAAQTSFLRRPYAPGRYYLAVTVGGISTVEGAPCDDGHKHREMMPFPDVAVNVDTWGQRGVSFRVTDAIGTRPVPAVREGGGRQFGWYQFDVSASVMTGACCLPFGGCEQLSEELCHAQAGGYNGDGSQCAGGPCDAVGACCLPGGSCMVVIQTYCTVSGGEFGGAGSDCGPQACSAPLHQNGPMITEMGTGPHGTNFSSNVAGVSTVGLKVTRQGAGPWFRLADDFVVDAPGGWTINHVVVHAYLPAELAVPYAFPPQSPWTDASVNLWDGIPGDPGSAIVASSQGPIQTGFTGIYRMYTSTNHQMRPIMYIAADMGGIRLSPGAYWIDFQLEGQYFNAKTGYAPIVMDLDAGGGPLIRLGNARALTETGWNETAVTPTNGAIELPFAILGTSCYANCDGSTIPPILNVDDFTCFINNFAAGQSLPHVQQVTAYANCDGSTIAPVLNVDDFTCFINEYATGCP